MKKIAFLFAMAFISAGVASAQGAGDVTGSWNGTLQLPGAALRLVFHISEADGLYTALMDSPDQGAWNMPTTSTTFDGETLTIIATDIGMTFTGKPDGERIVGTFRQGLAGLELILEKGAIVLNRPQEPKPEFPYHSQEVAFENKAAGVTLAGTLTRPRGEGKYPAAVMISGSGPQDRDEEIMGHKPFLVIADHLTRSGIAVLRVDDRGVGESGGVYAEASVQDFASDAMAAMDFLKTYPEIDIGGIGIIGHSLGGMLSYMIAAQRNDVAFIVSMAGPAISGRELLREQRWAISRAYGMAEEDFLENEKSVEKMQAVADRYTPEYIRDNMDELLEEFAPEEAFDSSRMLAYWKNEMIKMLMPEFSSMMRYDPTQDIEKTAVPVMALFGENDLQVPPASNIEALEAHLPKTPGNLVKVYPGLNHLFQHSLTGKMDEYVTIEETISTEVLSDIADWIAARAR